MNNINFHDKIIIDINNLFDENLRMSFKILFLPRPDSFGQIVRIPLFRIKMERNKIWQFPISGEEMEFIKWAANHNVYNLIKQYLNTPLKSLPNKTFELEKQDFIPENGIFNNYSLLKKDYGLTEIFKASDKRLSKEKLHKWAEKTNNSLVKMIFKIRF